MFLTERASKGEIYIMKKILNFNGKKSDMLIEIQRYSDSIQRLLIGEVGRTSTVTFMKYGGIQVEITMYALHIGESNHFLISVTNKITEEGYFFVYEGVWDHELVINTLYSYNLTCFREANFKDHRGILKEIGDLMYLVLTEFDGRFLLSIDYDNKEKILVKKDVYEVLTDLEWIEEVMEENIDISK